jgi:hypothetical protein
MEKLPSDFPSTDMIETTRPVASDAPTRSLAKVDIEAEHQLTFRHVWKHHKAIIGWSFFWAMCAIGWFVLSSSFSFPFQLRREPNLDFQGFRCPSQWSHDWCAVFQAGLWVITLSHIHGSYKATCR